jgi:hypothetical protein
MNPPTMDGSQHSYPGARPARRPASGRPGGVTRHELDETLTEVTSLFTQAREAGYDSDPAAERTHLTAARAQFADIIERIDDRLAELD